MMDEKLIEDLKEEMTYFFESGGTAVSKRLTIIAVHDIVYKHYGLLGCGVKTEKPLRNLENAACPLIKYLSENHHPHTTALVTGTSVEILEKVKSIPKIYDFIKD